MKSTLSTASLAITFLTLLVDQAYSQATPTDETDGQPTQGTGTGLTLRTPKYQGCFSDPGDMTDMGPYTFQAMGWCQPLCVRLAKPYLAFVNGTNCFCGDNAPSDNKVDDSNCEASCQGFPDQSCKFIQSRSSPGGKLMLIECRWWNKQLGYLQRWICQWRSHRNRLDHRSLSNTPSDC